MIYYCISDIHGCLFAFQNALDIITSHLSEENTALILLGDYIHGGKENAAVLDKIMELQNRYGSGKVIALLGNHEELVCEGMASVDACGTGSGDGLAQRTGARFRQRTGWPAAAGAAVYAGK